MHPIDYIQLFNCKDFKVSFIDSFLTTTIRKVIFNDPATIVIWGDGKKNCCKST